MRRMLAYINWAEVAVAVPFVLFILIWCTNFRQWVHEEPEEDEE
jgi:hypothetical protein